MAYLFGYGAFNTKKEIKAFNFMFEFKERELYICKLNGYKLRWNRAYKNYSLFGGISNILKNPFTHQAIKGAILMLNLQESKEDYTYGVMYSCDEYNFKLLDKENEYYDRIDITHLIDVTLPDNEKVYTYIPKLETYDIYNDYIKSKKVYINTMYYQGLKSMYENLENKKEFWHKQDEYKDIMEKFRKAIMHDDVKFIIMNN